MPTFEIIVRDFVDALNASREYLATIGPIVLKQHEESSNAAKEFMEPFRAAALFTEENIEKLQLPEEAKETILQIRSIAARASTMEPEKLEKWQEILRANLRLKVVNGRLEPDLDEPTAVQILQHAKAVRRAAHQVRLLRESALMALVSRTEWFVAQLVHAYYSRHPEAAGATEPFFSLQNLASLASIEDAREVLIEHRVEALMRQSIEDWMRFFKEKPKLGMSYLNNIQTPINEIFKRRNLVVHNGGRVSRRYLEEVTLTAGKTLQVGQDLEVTAEYLDSAIDWIEQGFVLLGAELWKKLYPDDEDRGKVLMDSTFEALLRERWSVARSLGCFGMNDKGTSEDMRVRAKINYWQSFKWAGEYDQVRSDIEKADFSAYSPIFRLAHAALTDNEDGFFELLPKLLESGEITSLRLKEWPLFRNIRHSPRFHSYQTRSEADLQSDFQNSESKPLVN